MRECTDYLSSYLQYKCSICWPWRLMHPVSKFASFYSHHSYWSHFLLSLYFQLQRHNNALKRSFILEWHSESSDLHQGQWWFQKRQGWTHVAKCGNTMDPKNIWSVLCISVSELRRWSCAHFPVRNLFFIIFPISTKCKHDACNRPMIPFQIAMASSITPFNQEHNNEAIKQNTNKSQNLDLLGRRTNTCLINWHVPLGSKTWLLQSENTIFNHS